MVMRAKVIKELAESAELNKALAERLAETIASAAQIIIDAYRAGKKVLLIGNGGSAADAQHLAAELVGRFLVARKALPAIALTTDTSVLTALSNDYGYDKVFSRQIEALAERGDVLLAMTTGGTSANILSAIETAQARGVAVIVMTGEKGAYLKDRAELALVVPAGKPPRVQEAHITIGHIICLLVEEELFNE